MMEDKPIEYFKVILSTFVIRAFIIPYMQIIKGVIYNIKAITNSLFFTKIIIILTIIEI